MMQRRIGFIATLALLCPSACGDEGSLGEYETGGDTSGGSSGMSETSNGSATSTSSTTGTQDSGSSASTAGTSDTGGPTGCDNPAYMCVDYPIECTPDTCGGLDSAFDENGCLRTACPNGDECGPGEVCYTPFDFGGCASSGISCEDDPETMSCQCVSLPDCGGSYCIPSELFPGVQGPTEPGIVDNTCAPNDGPAIALQLGLESADCSAALGPAQTVRIHLWMDGPQDGSYELGIDTGFGVYVDDKGVEHQAAGGTVNLTTAGDMTVSGDYVLQLEDDTFVYGEYGPLEYCDSPALCG